MKLFLAAVLCFYVTSTDGQSTPVRVSSGVMAGQLLHKVWPQFPEEAKRQHISGSVVMHVIIGEDGTVQEITPVSGPEILRKPYMDAVRQWTYRPFLLNGKPVPVDTTITLILDFGG